VCRLVAALLLLPLSALSFNAGPAGSRGGHAVTLSRSPVVSTMSIQDDIKDRIRSAMKGGPDRKAELQALRLMASAMTTKTKESGAESLDDEQAKQVLTKLAKMRKESIEMFEAGGKMEAAALEKTELAILEGYLPAIADEATVRGWIADAIVVACPDGPDKSKMGQVMGALMKAHKGEFDGKQANKWVAEMLK